MPEPCGLTLLCDLALHYSAQLSPTQPHQSPRHVRFHQEDDVRVLPEEPECEEDEPRSVLSLERVIEILMPELCATDVHHEHLIDARIEQAGFNREQNRRPFRYGEPSPIRNKRQRQEACDNVVAALAQRERHEALSSRGRHLLSKIGIANQEENATTTDALCGHIDRSSGAAGRAPSAAAVASQWQQQ